MLDIDRGQEYGGTRLKRSFAHPFAALVICRLGDLVTVWQRGQSGLYTRHADAALPGARRPQHAATLASGTSHCARDTLQAGLSAFSASNGPKEGNRQYPKYFEWGTYIGHTVKYLLESFVRAHTAYWFDVGSCFGTVLCKTPANLISKEFLFHANRDSLSDAELVDVAAQIKKVRRLAVRAVDKYLAEHVGLAAAAAPSAAIPLNGLHPILSDISATSQADFSFARAIAFPQEGIEVPIANGIGNLPHMADSAEAARAGNAAPVKSRIRIRDNLVDKVFDASRPQDDLWPDFSDQKKHKGHAVEPTSMLSTCDA